MRRLRFIATFLYASMIGYSVYNGDYGPAAFGFVLFLGVMNEFGRPNGT